MNKIPYFELKVVKVKKEKKEEKNFAMYCKYHNNCEYQKVEPYALVKEHRKGTCVNGENLDKIKFPCYCSFDANKGCYGKPNKTYKVHGIGRLDKTFSEGQLQYQLSWADRQSNREGDGSLSNLSVLCETPSLKRLIEIYNIKIRKAKLIIFEEEK